MSFFWVYSFIYAVLVWSQCSFSSVLILSWSQSVQPWLQHHLILSPHPSFLLLRSPSFLCSFRHSPRLCSYSCVLSSCNFLWFTLLSPSPRPPYLLLCTLFLLLSHFLLTGSRWCLLAWTHDKNHAVCVIIAFMGHIWYIEHNYSAA